MDPKPTQIGPYQIEAEIGRGEVAVVYRGHDTLYDRAVALKVLQPHLAHDMAFARRFVSAGREAIRLRHPNILPVYDAGQSDGQTYIAMELASGETLAARLARHEGPFAPDAALAAVEQIAAALDYAHLRGFVHHNLKPNNIFLLPGGKVLVGDFDTGIPAGSAQPLVHRLRAAAYLAPEQAAGQERIDAAADIYSLGAIAYTLFAGHPPFESTNPLGLVRQIVEKTPARADSVNPALQATVVDALARSLSKDPAQRPARAGELRKWLQGEMAVPPAADAPSVPSKAASTPEAAHEIHQGSRGVEPPGAAAADLPVPNQPADEIPSVPAGPPRMPVVRSVLPPLIPSPPVNIRLPFVPLARQDEPAPAAPPPKPPPASRMGRLRANSPVSMPALAALLIGALVVLLVLLALVQSAGTLLTRIAAPEADEIGQVVVVDEPEVALVPTVTPRAAQSGPIPPPTRVAQRPTRTPVSKDLLVKQELDDGRQDAEKGTATALRRAVVVEATDTPPASPTPLPTSTAAPTSTPLLSPTPQPSSTPAPTATPTQTATPTLSPTPTETPTPSLTPTATETPTPLPPPPNLAGHIAYSLWNIRTDRPDIYIFDVPGRVHLTPIANRRQPDFNFWGGLAANAEGGGMDNLVQMGPVGQDPWIISAHPEDAHPHWSPDAKKLVFDSAYMGDRQHRIYLQDDLANRRERAPMMYDAWELFGRYPIFLADGRIAFNGCNYWDTGSVCGVQVVDTYGGMPSSASGWPGDVPTDNLGSGMLLMSDRAGNWEVYSMNADGSGLAQLTNHPGRDGLATAAPDGGAIAFLTDRDGIWSVYVMRPDGSDPRKLFDLPGSFGQGEYDWFQERLTWGP